MSDEQVTISIPLDVAERWVREYDSGRTRSSATNPPLARAFREALEARKPKWTWKPASDNSVDFFENGVHSAYFVGALTHAQADAIVAVLNGDTPQPVAWDENGYLYTASDHATHGLCACTPLFDHPPLPADQEVLFLGTVTGQGGGQVCVTVDRDTEYYPPVGKRVRVVAVGTP